MYKQEVSGGGGGGSGEARHKIRDWEHACKRRSLQDPSAAPQGSTNPRLSCAGDRCRRE